MTNMKKRSTAVLTAAILATALTIPATATAAPTESIRISSYKSSTLEVGERSGLIISPSGMECTVISSNPDTVVVEQVLTFWVAVARAEGSAEITTSNSAGERETLTLTVSPVAPAAPEYSASEDNTSLTDNMAIRQEMIRLINQPRRAMGVGAAGQRCPDERCPSLLRPTLHLASCPGGKPSRCRCRLPLYNLTVFTGTADAAQRAVDN